MVSGVRKEDMMSWDDLGKLMFERIKRDCKPKNLKLEPFLKWFAERERVGLRFDHQLVYKAWQISNILKNEQDYFCVVTGKEGSGKSTLAIQLATWVDPGFSSDGIYYSGLDYKNMMQERAEKMLSGGTESVPPATLVVDEAVLSMSTGDSLTREGKELLKLFATQRILNCCVILCIPNFFILGTYIRQHRIGLLIINSKKTLGAYKGVDNKGIEIINQNYNKQRNKNIYVLPLPYGTFFLGNFHKSFPKSISYEEYKKHKLRNLHDFIKDIEPDQGGSLVKGAKLAKTLGISTDTVISWIKKGKVEGKQVGGHWFVTKEAYNRVLEGV